MKRRLRLLGSMLLACSMCLSSPAVALAEEIPEAAAEISKDADTQLIMEDTGTQEDGDTQESLSEETTAADISAEETKAPEAQALLEEEDSATAEPLMAAEDISANCPEPLAVEPTEEGTGNTEQLYNLPSNCSASEWEMLRLVNKERLSKGLLPLSTFSDLQKSCDTREAEIIKKFDHVRPDDVSYYYTAFEGTAQNHVSTGENIAAGNQAPADTFQQWMDSPGHRANMLSENYTHMGVGYRYDSDAPYKHYWVQMFLGGCTPTDIKVQGPTNLPEFTGSFGSTIDSLNLVLEVTSDHGTSYLPLMQEMCSGYDATKVGVQQTIRVAYGELYTYFYLKIPTTVTYRTHVQTRGWLDWASNGTESGTTGEAKRLEGIELKLDGQTIDGDIEYRTHVQTHGWMDWKKNGAMSGTTGEAKRLEAIQIKLTGDITKYYDVYYRVHAQTFGWMGWAKNGESAGTEGYAKRLESIQIKLVEKGGAAPGTTEGAYKTPLLQYKTHVQTYGWQSWTKEGDVSGTTGQSKRLEGINIELLDPKFSGGIRYKTHVQTYGWQDWVKDGAMSGTTGEAKRLEAIQIELTGEMAEKYDVYYQVHAQTFGWMGWAKNGEKAGTAGYSKRLEGIRIQLVPKGGSAPGKTDSAFVEK